MSLPPLPPLEPMTDERVQQQIRQTFASLSLPPKKDRLISGTLAIGIFDLFLLIWNNFNKSQGLPTFWNWQLALSLIAFTLAWNFIGALFWVTIESSALQAIISKPDFQRLHHTEAWASLWFGGELLLLSFLGVAWSLFMWNAFTSLERFNFVPLGLYALLYPLLFWQRRWLLRLGIAFEFNLLGVLGPLSLLITLLSIFAPLTRHASIGYRFWVINGVGVVLYGLTCIAVGAAIRLFCVARIHFQAYRELLNRAD